MLSARERYSWIHCAIAIPDIHLLQEIVQSTKLAIAPQRSTKLTLTKLNYSNSALTFPSGLSIRWILVLPSSFLGEIN